MQDLHISGHRRTDNDPNVDSAPPSPGATANFPEMDGRFNVYATVWTMSDCVALEKKNRKKLNATQHMCM